MNIFDQTAFNSFIQIATFTFISTGIILLILSINYFNKFSKTLIKNEYSIKKWRFINFLIIFFIVSYAILSLNILGLLSLPFNPIILIGLITFFGAIFVLLLMQSTYSLIKNILGEEISDNEAIKIFLNYVDKEEKDFEHLHDNFDIQCKSCERTISYSIAEVIKQNYCLPDKGVSIQEVFGVQTFILRPSHKCKLGRREIDVVHDQSLAYRSSMDKTRIKIASKI